MKKITKIIVGLTVVMTAMIGAMVPVFAANDDDPFCGNNIPAEIRKEMGCENASEEGLPKAVVNIINFVIGVGGLIAVVYIVIGGINYITSNGDAAKIAKAKNTILYALIGLLVAALAFAIVNFALGALTTE